jgi:hypothetical protein
VQAAEQELDILGEWRAKSKHVLLSPDHDNASDQRFKVDNVLYAFSQDESRFQSEPHQEHLMLHLPFRRHSPVR